MDHDRTVISCDFGWLLSAVSHPVRKIIPIDSVELKTFRIQTNPLNTRTMLINNLIYILIVSWESIVSAFAFKMWILNGIEN